MEITIIAAIIILLMIIRSTAKHKQVMTSNRLRLFLAWLLFSPVYFYLAKKYKVEEWKRWVFLIISPLSFLLLSIFLLIFVALIIRGQSGYGPEPYEFLRFTTKKEIEEVTGISSFPEFTYLNDFESPIGEKVINIYLKEGLSSELKQQIDSLTKTDLKWIKEKAQSAITDSIYIFKDSWIEKDSLSPTDSLKVIRIELHLPTKGKNARILYSICFGCDEVTHFLDSLRFSNYDIYYFSNGHPDFTGNFCIEFALKFQNDSVLSIIQTDSLWVKDEDIYKHSINATNKYSCELSYHTRENVMYGEYCNF